MYLNSSLLDAPTFCLCKTGEGGGVVGVFFRVAREGKKKNL